MRIDFFNVDMICGSSRVGLVSNSDTDRDFEVQTDNRRDNSKFWLLATGCAIVVSTTLVAGLVIAVVASSEQNSEISTLAPISNSSTSAPNATYEILSSAASQTKELLTRIVKRSVTSEEDDKSASTSCSNFSLLSLECIMRKWGISMPNFG